jgi:hypothetical protein
MGEGVIAEKRQSGDEDVAVLTEAVKEHRVPGFSGFVVVDIDLVGHNQTSLRNIA